jgi:hypothetical protein
VRAIASKDGDVARAFAICVAQGQKIGDLKPGSIEPTAQGKKRSKRKSGEKGAGAKADEYKALLAAARVSESLLWLVRRGRALIEQDAAASEGDGGEDSLAALDGEVSGDLQVSVTFPVGKATDDTRRSALKLLKHYKDTFRGGLGGVSVWTVSSMRVRYHQRDRVVELEMWINIKSYVGTKVLTDLTHQVSDAALELSRSMMPEDAKSLFGAVTPATVAVEPVEFVQAE